MIMSDETSFAIDPDEVGSSIDPTKPPWTLHVARCLDMADGPREGIQLCGHDRIRVQNRRAEFNTGFVRQQENTMRNKG